LAVLCVNELHGTVICGVIVCDSVFTGIVVCEDEPSGDALLDKELHPVEICTVEVCDGEGLLSVDGDMDMLGFCDGNAFVAGEALDDAALEIVVVDVAKIFACETTPLAPAASPIVVRLQAVCGQPVYVMSSD